MGIKQQNEELEIPINALPQPSKLFRKRVTNTDWQRVWRTGLTPEERFHFHFSQLKCLSSSM